LWSFLSLFSFFAISLFFPFAKVNQIHNTTKQNPRKKLLNCWAVIKTPPTLKIRGGVANFALPKGKSLSLFILSDDNLSLLLRWKVKYNYLIYKRFLHTTSDTEESFVFI